MRIEPDGTGTMTLEAIADPAVVQAAPGLAEDLRFDDAVADGWSVDGPTPTDDGGLRVVLSRPFLTIDEANVLLQSINGPSGPLRGAQLTRTGGVDGSGVADGSDSVLTLTGQLGISGGVDAFADPDLLAKVGASPYAADIAAAGLTAEDTVTFRLDVDAPGSVTSGGAGATEDDGVLSWTAPLDGSTIDVATVYDVSAGGGFWRLVSNGALVLLIVWCLASTGFIVFVARERKRRQLAAARQRGTSRRHPVTRVR